MQCILRWCIHPKFQLYPSQCVCVYIYIYISNKNFFLPLFHIAVTCNSHSFLLALHISLHPTYPLTLLIFLPHLHLLTCGAEVSAQRSAQRQGTDCHHILIHLLSRAVELFSNRGNSGLFFHGWRRLDFTLMTFLHQKQPRSSWNCLLLVFLDFLAPSFITPAWL